MRILLAAEGPSDEVVCEHLIRQLDEKAEVYPKRFPARGFPVVRRLLSDVVRAAYFGQFDVLVVHFDLNSSLPRDFRKVAESPRWQEVQSAINVTIEELPQIGREKRLCTALVTPCQSTDAWLTWGVENNDGRIWEQHPRHELKRKLFGSPPRRLIEKSKPLAIGLADQMTSNERWPRSLRESVTSLETSLLPKET